MANDLHPSPSPPARVPEGGVEKVALIRLVRRTVMVALGLTVVMAIMAAISSYPQPSDRVGGPSAIGWLINLAVAGLWLLFLVGIWKRPRTWSLPVGISLCVAVLHFGTSGWAMRENGGMAPAMVWGGPILLAAAGCLTLRRLLLCEKGKVHRESGE